MIASFSHNFIFLKTRKVGGTSMEIVMSSWCGGRDICTPVTEEDEELRREHGGEARNFGSPTGEAMFINHMPARAVRAKLPGLWSRAFKFSVDRHPYEKVISRAFWNIGRRGGNPDEELADEIDQALIKRNYINFPIYMINRKPAVDEVWRYEDAWTKLAALAERLGVAVPEQPPRAKGGYRKDPRSAAEILSPEQREQIYRDARIEFDLLGYEP